MTDDRSKYENDVFYEVWRSGGNPHAIDFDRVDDQRYRGMYAEEAAAYELRAQHRRTRVKEPEYLGD